MRQWSVRHWSAAVVVTAFAALVIGVPTGIIPTPIYTRMTPVLWWNYPVWVLSAILEGLLIATYVRTGERDRATYTPFAEVSDAADTPHGAPPADTARPRSGRAIAAGILSTIAVGCPICNKLVVLALGVSGALSYFAPAQPLLAVASLALLGHALMKRLRYATACPIPS